MKDFWTQGIATTRSSWLEHCKNARVGDATVTCIVLQLGDDGIAALLGGGEVTLDDGTYRITVKGPRR